MPGCRLSVSCPAPPLLVSLWLLTLTCAVQVPSNFAHAAYDSLVIIDGIDPSGKYADKLVQLLSERGLDNCGVLQWRVSKSKRGGFDAIKTTSIRANEKSDADERQCLAALVDNVTALGLDINRSGHQNLHKFINIELGGDNEDLMDDIGAPVLVPTVKLLDAPDSLWPSGFFRAHTASWIFKWKEVSGADSYRLTIWQGKACESGIPLIDTVVQGSSHTIPKESFSADTLFCWTVTAHSSKGQDSARSEPVSFQAPKPGESHWDVVKYWLLGNFWKISIALFASICVALFVFGGGWLRVWSEYFSRVTSKRPIDVQKKQRKRNVSIDTQHHLPNPPPPVQNVLKGEKNFQIEKLRIGIYKVLEKYAFVAAVDPEKIREELGEAIDQVLNGLGPIENRNSATPHSSGLGPPGTGRHDDRSSRTEANSGDAPSVVRPAEARHSEREVVSAASMDTRPKSEDSRVHTSRAGLDVEERRFEEPSADPIESNQTTASPGLLPSVSFDDEYNIIASRSAGEQSAWLNSKAVTRVGLARGATNSSDPSFQRDSIGSFFVRFADAQWLLYPLFELDKRLIMTLPRLYTYPPPDIKDKITVYRLIKPAVCIQNLDFWMLTERGQISLEPEPKANV